VNQFDYYDQSCLIHAAGVADLPLIELLVKSGADVNKCDSNGVYPLHCAIMRLNDDICDFLLKSGARVDLTDK
jgi:ankyrin repeat protein